VELRPAVVGWLNLNGGTEVNTIQLRAISPPATSDGAALTTGPALWRLHRVRDRA